MDSDFQRKIKKAMGPVAFEDEVGLMEVQHGIIIRKGMIEEEE